MFSLVISHTIAPPRHIHTNEHCSVNVWKYSLLVNASTNMYGLPGTPFATVKGIVCHHVGFLPFSCSGRSSALANLTSF